MAIKES